MKTEKISKDIKGLLVDIDGTLYFKGKAIPKAVETVNKLNNAGFKIIFLTNTDSKSPRTIFKTLKNYDFDINIEEIFSPIIALREFLSKYPKKKSYFVTTAEKDNPFLKLKDLSLLIL